MSVVNLSSGQINSFDCPCNISGAITSSTSVNFKRFNGIVYMSIPAQSGAVGVAGPSIVYTPTVTIPSQYAPVAGVSRYPSVANNGVAALGQLSFANTLASFNFTLQAGGNFVGAAGVIDNVLMWAAAN